MPFSNEFKIRHTTKVAQPSSAVQHAYSSEGYQPEGSASHGTAASPQSPSVLHKQTDSLQKMTDPTISEADLLKLTTKIKLCDKRDILLAILQARQKDSAAAIVRRRHSTGVTSISSMKIKQDCRSWKPFPLAEESHFRRWSYSAPNLRLKRKYLLQTERYAVPSKTHVEALADHSRKGRYVSATSKDWELQLIEGLLENESEFEDIPVTTFLEPRHSLAYDTSCRSTLSRLPQQPMPKSAKSALRDDAERKRALEIQRLSLKPVLTVVQAIQATEIVVDDCDYSPVSPLEDDNGVLEASECAQDISPFSDVPDIRLDADDWPLPKAEVPALPSRPDVGAARSHPLRSNPLKKLIHKSVSKSSLRSVASNRSNRSTFVLQKNDSSFSLHSQGTVTDLSSMLAPTIASKHKLQDLSASDKLNAKHSITHSAGRVKPFAVRTDRERHLPFASTMLTPVTETFNKLTRRDSYTGSEADSLRRPSSSHDVVSARKEKREWKFSGGLVGTRGKRLQDLSR